MVHHICSRIIPFLFLSAHLSEQIQLLQGVAHGNIHLDVHIINAGLQLNAARTQKLPSSKASLLTLTREPRLASANLVGSHALLQSLCIMGECYDVCYVLDGPREKQLSASIIAEYVEYAGRPNRSL